VPRLRNPTGLERYRRSAAPRHCLGRRNCRRTSRYALPLLVTLHVVAVAHRRPLDTAGPMWSGSQIADRTSQKAAGARARRCRAGGNRTRGRSAGGALASGCCRNHTHTSLIHPTSPNRRYPRPPVPSFAAPSGDLRVQEYRTGVVAGRAGRAGVRSTGGGGDAADHSCSRACFKSGSVS
jgi:hypothetical protein